MSDFWETAGIVCTAKQLRVLELRDRHGFSLSLISLTTRVSIRTVRNQLDAARQKIDNALREAA